jgi:hypothetical protein
MNVKKVFLIIALLTSISALRAIEYNQNVSAIISLKTPGNYAKSYLLTLKELNANGFNYLLESDNPLPVTLFQNVENKGETKRITLYIFASEDIYFNYGTYSGAYPFTFRQLIRV